MTETVAVAVIIQDKKVLLQQRAVKEPGLDWCFPGGVVEQGEDLNTAIIREIMEESGVTIKPLHILGDKHVTRGETEHFHIVYILCAYVAGEPEVKEPRESAAIAWVPVDENLKSRVGRDYMPFIHDYLQTL